MSDRTESSETTTADVTAESTTADDTTMDDSDQTDETETTATEQTSTTATEQTETTATDQADDSVFGSRFRRWVNYLVLAALAILALVAGVRFYAAVGTIIDRFVVREFRPIFHAVFNLALLFLAGAGVTIQLKRMR